MAKTLAEIYGFKKSSKRIDAKNLRKLILKEYRSILIEQEEEAEEAETSGPLNGEYKGDSVDKTTNVRDVDPVEIANQLLSGDDDSPIVASTAGEWFATNGAQAKEWIEKIGPDVFVTRLKDLAKKVPTTGLPKSVMPFLPGPGDAQGDFSQVEDALTPGGEFNVDTHPESDKKGEDEKDAKGKKEAVFRAAEYLISEKTAPPKPNTFTSMDAAAEEFMTGGLVKQDGDEGDDAIKITKGGSLAATDAIPTQSNILIYKGLGMAMNPKNQIAGGPLDAWAGINGEILDGHHRWAATMFNDPGASMGLAGQVDLQGLGKGNEQEVLKYLTAIGNALGNQTKTESRRRRGSRDEVIMERWNKLAGLLRD